MTVPTRRRGAARGWSPLVLAWLAVVAGCSAKDASPVAPAVQATTLPDYVGTLLADARIAALGGVNASAWQAYVLHSREHMQRDQALVQAELTKVGAPSVIRPPNTAADFTVQSIWTPAWVAGVDGRALVRAVLSYQTASGGWGKHIDYAKGVRQPGMGYNSESDEWAYVGTIDNGATVNELRLLGIAAPTDTAARSAFERGVSYLLDAQFPTGCWPQVFPLMGSYHDAVTNNDNAESNVIRLFRDIGKGTYTAASADAKVRAAAAVVQATRCLMVTQVVVRAVRTTWAQQHDPLTNEPVIGRSYELPSLAGQEGARILDVLMEDPSPSADVVAAAYAAAAFYKATAIPNVQYVSGVGLVAAPGAGPLWARMVEIGTNRPIFSNRDGVLLYDFDQLTDRRTGYSWYGSEPGTSLRTFDTWSRSHALAP